MMFESKRRRWRLWQIESSIACNLKCIMCPWTGVRESSPTKGRLSQDVWEALKPYLIDVQSVDFTGGGEPLLQPFLAQWISDARAAGCETGFLTNGLLLNNEKARQFLDAGLDWICFSMDGADADTYERVRLGSSFKTVCTNITRFCQLKGSATLKTMINFVVMTMNAHQLEAMVELASELGVDQINFKQCDVIRGEHGKGLGVFSENRSKAVKELEKQMDRARKTAEKLGIETTAFSFVPEELPVCAQDPRNSLFVRHDGYVAPCINLAIGGPTTFLGREVTMPSIHYGRLPDQEINSLWETDTCRFYRDRFEQRVTSNEEGFARVDLSEPSLIKLKEAHRAAAEAMSEAPEGCRVCHYLYGI